MASVRNRSILTFLIFSTTSVACGSDPVYEFPRNEDMSVGGEVFRVFCKREARDSFPNDLDGMRFNEACDGKGALTESTPRLNAMLQRRDTIKNTIDRVLGEDDVTLPAGVTVLEDGELQTFLEELVPLYDEPREVLPGATRAIASALSRLIDPNDQVGRDALKALGEITEREGYRRAELALGLLRPLFEYPELDTFAENGLKAIGEGGVAEESLDEIALGLGYELATYDPAPFEPDATLLVARDFLLSPIEQVDQPTRAPISVTLRDARGQAVPKGGVTAPFVDADGDGFADVDAAGKFVSGTGAPVPSPFAVPGEDGMTLRDPQGRALKADGTPMFEDFDAQLTMAAAFLREDARLSSINAGDRTTFEKFGRGLSALFGQPTMRSKTYGSANVQWDGHDPGSAAFHLLAHGIGSAVAANPEAARKLMLALSEAMRTNEPAMAQLVQTMLNINERSKQPRHDGARLVGETSEDGPHRFWDDLLAVGQRITKRPGMIEAILRMSMEPATADLGQLVAKWMEFSDKAPYKNADFTPGNANGTFTAQQEADLNAQVTVNYQTPVDRTQPQIGANRSVFTQTLSMVHSLAGRNLCNREGTKINLVISGLGEITHLLEEANGYPECGLFNVPDMIQIWVKAILGTSRITLDAALLGLLGDISTTFQEVETQIHGFNGRPSPESFARFLFGPPNQFSEQLIDPVQKDGAYIGDIDPYALFAMEVPHADIGGTTFLEAAKPLVAAFEENELKTDVDPLTGGGGAPTDGYMFSELLDAVYMHWAPRSDAPCVDVSQGACTQHIDPNAPFFSYQTGLVTYEPLLIESLRDERMLEVLGDAAAALDAVTIEGESGLTLLAQFVEALMKPQEGLQYLPGTNPKLETALTNVGEEVGYVSPMYLLLDGLKNIDENFDGPYAETHDAWLEARSEMVDLFLTTEDDGNGGLRLKDRIGRSVFTFTLDFLADRIQAHIDAGDAEEWGKGLGQRSADFFDSPLISGALHLFEDSWAEPAAGRELMKFIRYLVDDSQNPLGFETTLVAVVDLLQLLEDAPRIAPLLAVSSEAVVPGVTETVSGASTAALDPATGVLRHSIELMNDLLKLHLRRPSTLSRVAGNLVRTAAGDTQTPLETMLDMLAEVQRLDASQPADAALTSADLERIAQVAHDFIADDGNGLERLYAVIQNRAVVRDGDTAEADGGATPTADSGTAAPTPTPMSDGGMPMQDAAVGAEDAASGAPGAIQPAP